MVAAAGRNWSSSLDAALSNSVTLQPPSLEAVLAEFVRRGMTGDDVSAMRASGDVCLNRPAIRLPYFTLDGRESDFHRWRCLDDLKPKYLQARGTGVHIYLPPGPDWASIAADPKIVIGVSEGEITSYVITKRTGLPTIGLGGVNSYGSKRAGELILKELLPFNWTGREVLMMFDSDSHA